jgi:hypothetical protein
MPLEQFSELVAGQAGAAGDLLRQPAAQVAVVPWDDHAAAVAGAPQDNVTAGLVIYGQAGPFQRLDDSARRDRGQAGHQAVSRDTLNRPTNCSSRDSMGIGSPCLSRLAQ